MSALLDVVVQPVTVPIPRTPEGYVYELVEDWEYHWEKDGITQRIYIHAGFQFDGASVPAVARMFVERDGLQRAAALPHDLIYRHRGRLPLGHHQWVDGGMWRDVVVYRWSRKDADRLFGRIMREAGVKRSVRRAAYLAVRAFGWWAWRS
ncbi:MAG TPA: DUF1353 domain-containing protein [Rhodothermales bacterium]